MGHLVGIAQLLHSRGAVAAADDGDGVGLAEGLSHGLSTLGKGGELKHAHGAVPNHGAGVGHGVTVQLHGLGTDVQALPAIGDLPGLDHLALGVRGEGVGADRVHRQQQLHALGSRFFHHFVGVSLPVGLQQAVAHLAALGGGERVGHAAADDDGVGDLQQVVDDTDLAGDLAAAQNGHQGPLGVGQGAADDLQLLLDQEAGHGRQIVRHAGGGGVGPVDGAEGVRHIQVRHIRQGLGQSRVVLGLALFKAGVLQQHDLAGLQGGGLGPGVGAHHILRHDDGLAQQLAQALGHGLEAQGRVRAVLRLAQMGAGDDGSVLVQKILDSGQGGPDALVVGDDAAAVFSQGHVEIAAQQNLLAGHVHVPDSLLFIIHWEFLRFISFLSSIINCIQRCRTMPSLRYPASRETRFAAGPRRHIPPRCC